MKNIIRFLIIFLFSAFVVKAQTGCTSGDCKNGQGTFYYVNGGKYIGEFKDGKRNGKGTHYWINGDRYVGEFKNNKENGQGTFFWIDGSKYIGEYKDGKINGQGTFYYTNGNKYVGEFLDNKKNGQGTFYWKNTGKYVGEYKDDRMNGQGTHYYENGDKYVGEFLDNKKNGQGTFYWKNGNKCISEWKDDKKIGKCVDPYDATIHFILFADTEDSRIGASCKEADKYLRKTFIPQLKWHTDLKVKTYYHSNKNFTLASLSNIIDNLKVESNDVIFFYYIGHGYNRGDSNFPTLLLGNNQKKLIDIYNSLKDENHRLLIVMADTGNSLPKDKKKSNKENTDQSKVDWDNDIQNIYTSLKNDKDRHWKFLFVHSKGDYVISASKVNQNAYMQNGTGEIFSTSFRDAFNYYVNANYKEKSSWKKIFDRTKNNTMKAAKNIGSIQEPQWCGGSCD